MARQVRRTNGQGASCVQTLWKRVTKQGFSRFDPWYIFIEAEDGGVGP